MHDNPPSPPYVERSSKPSVPVQLCQRRNPRFGRRHRIDSLVSWMWCIRPVSLILLQGQDRLSKAVADVAITLSHAKGNLTIFAFCKLYLGYSDLSLTAVTPCIDSVRIYTRSNPRDANAQHSPVSSLSGCGLHRWPTQVCQRTQLNVDDVSLFPYDSSLPYHLPIRDTPPLRRCCRSRHMWHKASKAAEHNA